MRRFSQRNSLVTLSDINITPLMDLAFVLLIIFVIISSSIRPTKEQGMDLNLPRGGGPDRQISPGDIRVVEISPKGDYVLDGKKIAFEMIEAELVRSVRQNPRTIVYIRADEEGRNKHTVALLEICQRNGILLSIRTRK